MLVAGWSAYPRKVDWKAFADIAHEVGALLFTDIEGSTQMLHRLGDRYP